MIFSIIYVLFGYIMWNKFGKAEANKGDYIDCILFILIFPIVLISLLISKLILVIYNLIFKKF